MITISQAAQKRYRMFLLYGLSMRFFGKKEILPDIGEERKSIILFYAVDQITERQARLYAGLFVERSDVMPQGADRNMKP